MSWRTARSSVVARVARNASATAETCGNTKRAAKRLATLFVTFARERLRSLTSCVATKKLTWNRRQAVEFAGRRSTRKPTRSSTGERTLERRFRARNCRKMPTGG
uniref:(northern house mosquito) hypothetical protein n=1 Tax=Culex pipiens TaxID=7175 RepID=A0A8D8HUM4_CULPI